MKTNEYCAKCAHCYRENYATKYARVKGQFCDINDTPADYEHPEVFGECVNFKSISTL